jgi:TonB family protein
MWKMIGTCKKGSQLVLVFITPFLINVAPDLSLAELPFVWSDNPGAFEQHLIRRFKNPLFPKARRQITHAEITKARERDIRDYKELNDRLITLLEDISSLADPIDSSAINRIRGRMEDLIQDAMGVGGQAYDLATKTKQYRKELISDWAKGLSDKPDALRRLEQAELYYHENSLKFEIPFIAQTIRGARSIPSEEIIPALLMEQPNTIAMSIAMINDPSKQSAFRQGTLQVLQTGLDEGAHIEDLEEILKALDDPENYLKESRNKAGPLTPLAQDQIRPFTPSVDPAPHSIYSDSPPKLEKKPDASEVLRDSPPGFSKGKTQYLVMVEDAIDGQWIAPPLMGSNALVVLKFHIARSGEISRIQITESSGHAPYDAAAQRAVQAVNPLPPSLRMSQNHSLMSSIDLLKIKKKKELLRKSLSNNA